MPDSVCYLDNKLLSGHTLSGPIDLPGPLKWSVKIKGKLLVFRNIIKNIPEQ